MNKEKTLVKWNQLIVSLSLLLFVFNAQAALNPPELRCVSVDSLGQATITWIAPNDPGNEFLSYSVFVSNVLTGPYVMTTVNGLATSQYTDLVNDASLGNVFFFVQTVFDDGSGPTSSISSDTGTTILPIFSAVTDSTNTIDWNPIFVPDLGTSGGVYSVFRRIGSQGPFSQIGSRNYGAESFDDSFKVCSDTLFYRIEISDGLGCISKSAVLIGLFEDKTPPATPIYDSITVDGPSQEVYLGWKPSSSPDTKGYMVLYWTKATLSYVIRDTVWGINTTFFQESLPIIDPTLESEQYTVTAFDSCFTPNANTSPAADDQKTIFLEAIPNNCENTVALNWSPYINWDDLDGYEVLVSVSGRPFQMVTTLPKTDTAYVHQKSSNLDLYCYVIRAINSSGQKSSSSNRKCALSSSLIVPSQQYFKKITVENNSSLHIESLTDTTLPAEEYVLFRSLEKIPNFYEVTRIPFNNTSRIALDDFEASVDETSYYYRIGIIDTCGSIMYMSKPANSIFLHGNMSDDSLHVSLNWNSYIGWDSVGSGVSKYIIYKLIDNQREAIDSVDRFTTEYTYPILDEITHGAVFCFEIEAVEGDGNIYQMQDTALSNRICFSRNLNVFVPNAFRPNGANPIFTPVISFGEIASFRMTIFNRWGTQVFETSDIINGWDGILEGKPAQFGSYVYHIEVSNFTGATFNKSGTFVLLK
jgi:gliding motility-associated-like protein